MIWLLGDKLAIPQVRTRDEHDKDVESKPFPDKEYIREMVQFWMTHTMNLWEKSRQIMASWTLCALYLHDTQFHKSRLNFIQSKKEADSNALLQRCFFMWQHQEPWLKAMYPAEYSYCHLKFYAVGDKVRNLAVSELFAIPQGGDIIRQYTGSGLFIDEAAFHPDLEAAVGAAQPMVKDGGRIDLVSTAEPGYFQDVAEDRIK